MSKPLRVLLDQNIPRAVAAWLRRLKPNWEVFHTAEVGLSGKDDKKIFEWALAQKTLIITFDEDFADRRSFSVSKHYGIVRLRIWPTTIEETQRALERLLSEVPDEELSGGLVIVGRTRIRVRPRISDEP